MIDRPLTRRQVEVFNWLLNYSLEHLYQPGYRELGARFGLKTGSVLSVVKSLDAAGLIRMRGSARSVEFLRREPIEESP